MMLYRYGKSDSKFSFVAIYVELHRPLSSLLFCQISLFFGRPHSLSAFCLCRSLSGLQLTTAKSREIGRIFGGQERLSFDLMS